MRSLSRIEKDTMGEVEVPSDALWGAQTQRAILNFNIGNDLMPINIIHALAQIKIAAAKANEKIGVLDSYKSSLIVKAANEISQGLHDNQFPLKVWQSGSGTQTNMNVNEVISNLASKSSGEKLGSHKPIHPNDDVNKSQSTNDTFPTAIHIASIEEIKKNLLPEIQRLIEIFDKKSSDWNQIIKVGRTHLQDAVPMTMGQEVSAWRDQISAASNRIKNSIDELYYLPLGGTAVGTGINSAHNFDQLITEELSTQTKLPFLPAINKFAIMASHDGLLNTMSQVKILAVTLLKIFNDIRLLSCGPRAGLAELKLPANEPGSSIMPGKVNPTQCEAMSMVCNQIIGLEVAVSMAGSGGHLQMNCYKPLIGLNLIKSIKLLSDACRSCRENMLNGMKPDREKIQAYIDKSLMLVTALAPHIGYEKSCKIANLAYTENISLREASKRLNFISESDFNKIVNPISMLK